MLFPDWDDQALKEVILNSKGNMDDCIKTITSWYAPPSAFSPMPGTDPSDAATRTADDDGTSTNAMRELNDKLNIVAEVASASLCACAANSFTDARFLRT